MEIDGVQLYEYKEFLEIIQGQVNHLLLGNGFNRGLGINTGYPAIFEKMINTKQSVYKDVEDLVEKCNYDLEVFIGRLQEDINPDNTFLKKYINNKIKLDFMKATHKIVKKEIKQVYAEKNEGVFILMKEFTNFFTLNYDPFLYLLLLNFKAPEKENLSIIIQPTLKFIQDDINIQENRMYDEIKELRYGAINITTKEDTSSARRDLDKIPKTTFTSIIKEYAKSKNKDWKSADIDRIVNHILEEEKDNLTLEQVDDGAQISLFGNNEFEFNIESQTQNLFFLHGAFHIYKDGKSIKKITQQTDKALYDRLESILNSEEQEIVCIFQSTNKIDSINENEYLLKCYNSLGELSGNLFILGSALSENDKHIFDKINESEIENIYISTTHFNEEDVRKGKEFFPNKNIHFVDALSISYKIHEQTQ